jgi:hypothetical protein
VSGDTKAGDGANGLGKHGIRAEQRRDSNRIRVEIEELPDPPDRNRQIAEIVEAKRASQRPISPISHGDDAGAVGESQRPPVEAAVALFDSGNRSFGEESE